MALSVDQPVQHRRVRAATAAALLIATAACNVRSQAIPDLNDQAAVDRVVQQLGTDMTPEQQRREEFPDGLYFQWWVNRRVKFLAGQDRRCDVPAPEAPRSVGEAIAIEKVVAPKQIALDKECPDLMLRDLQAANKRQADEQDARLAEKNRREEEAGATASALAKQDDACRQRQQDAEFALADPRKLDAFVATHPCAGGNITGR